MAIHISFVFVLLLISCKSTSKGTDGLSRLQSPGGVEDITGEPSNLFRIHRAIVETLGTRSGRLLVELREMQAPFDFYAGFSPREGVGLADDVFCRLKASLQGSNAVSIEFYDCDHVIDYLEIATKVSREDYNDRGYDCQDGKDYCVLKNFAVDTLQPDCSEADFQVLCSFLQLPRPLAVTKSDPATCRCGMDVTEALDQIRREVNETFSVLDSTGLRKKCHALHAQMGWDIHQLAFTEGLA